MYELFFFWVNECLISKKTYIMTSARPSCLDPLKSFAGPAIGMVVLN